MTLHVCYGGAHLLQAGTPEKWRVLALAAFDTYAPTPAALAELGIDADVAPLVHARTHAKLRSAAVSALRIDFEDGYGIRGDAEEDAAADAAAEAVNAMTQRPELGIRPKAFSAPTRDRALRTLDRFFAAVTHDVDLVVTLPKVQTAHDVAVAVGALAAIEQRYALAPLGLELMAETPAFFDTLARHGLEPLQQAAEGRLRSVHFGAYDLLSALGVPGHVQALDHPFCTPLRLALARACAPLGVPVYDGATLAMPVPVHRGQPLGDAERADNERVVLAAMSAHARNCRHALSLGYAGSWDLHPAQLVPRYLATAAFYLEALPAAGKRLAAFLGNAARATRVGQSFDDAASARGLLAFVASALATGLVDASDLPELPVSAEQLRTLSFDELVAQLPR